MMIKVRREWLTLSLSLTLCIFLTVAADAIPVTTYVMPIRRHHRWLHPIDWRELSASIRFRKNIQTDLKSGCLPFAD